MRRVRELVKISAVKYRKQTVKEGRSQPTIHAEYTPHIIHILSIHTPHNMNFLEQHGDIDNNLTYTMPFGAKPVQYTVWATSEQLLLDISRPL